MSNKYLNLDEAARLLAVSREELIRMRERQEIRGFSDRGAWKFKQDDVEALARERQADSNPEVQLFNDSSEDVPMAIFDDEDDVMPLDASDSAIIALDDDALDHLKTSDSDVRLVGGPEIDLGIDSDSDVKLVGLGAELPGDPGAGTDPEIQLLNPGSDSDVKLIRPDSDSDVKLSDDDSDSDVKLVGGASDDGLNTIVGPFTNDATDADLVTDPQSLKKSDSDVQLLRDESSDDIAIVPGDEEPISIDFGQTPPRRESVLADESGISLGGDSSLFLGAESGISLEGPTDSGLAIDAGADDDEGITLALDDDSGISIESGDSGISLESADSGISLGFAGNTVPMMDVTSRESVPETQFEIPSLDDEGSGYELQADETGVLDLQTSEFDEPDFATAGVADDDLEAAFDDDDLEASGDFGDEEDLDVFEPDEDPFGGEGAEAGFAPVAGRAPVYETEWSTGTFVMLTVSSLLMLVCGVVMIDLVKNTATSAQPNPISGFVLDSLGGLYK